MSLSAVADETVAEPGTARPMTIIGLMSGTSMDGVDAALLESDGEDVARPGLFRTTPYPEAFRSRLKPYLGHWEVSPDLIAELTDHHAKAVAGLLESAALSASDIDMIAFHGQTIAHDPDTGRTLQIGDAARLAQATGIPVISDFRSADVAAGGQGAPLVPIYHRSLVASLAKPVMVVNIGGVANVTWVGDGDPADPARGLVAFDTGPGNTPLDEWISRHTGDRFDEGGRLAASGAVDEARLAALLDHPYFAMPAPKSLDRLSFDGHIAPILTGLSAADGAALLAAFTAATIAQSIAHVPEAPMRWIVCGGGRHNKAIMDGLAARTGAPVETADDHGWAGDAVEAQAFAYLAARVRRGLPTTFPGTTGVRAPMLGGTYQSVA